MFYVVFFATISLAIAGHVSAYKRYYERIYGFEHEAKTFEKVNVRVSYILF